MISCIYCNDNADHYKIVNRHSQPNEYLGRHGCMAICNEFIRILRACGELAFNPTTKEISFTKDRVNIR